MTHAATLPPRARNAAFMEELRGHVKADPQWMSVGVKVSEHLPGTIHVERILVQAERGQGRGQQALTQLMALADTHQVDIVVQPQAITPDGNTDRLRAWYGKLGFQEDGRLLMRRRPARARPPVARSRDMDR